MEYIILSFPVYELNYIALICMKMIFPNIYFQFLLIYNIC